METMCTNLHSDAPASKLERALNLTQSVWDSLGMGGKIGSIDYY